MIARTIRYTLPAAYELLPARMRSPAADALLLAIAMQESRFLFRDQHGDRPNEAHGFWQFEPIGVRAVLEHHTTRATATAACVALCYSPGVAECYHAIAHNDVLAAVFARLLLWQHRDPLPPRGSVLGAWEYYLAQWRPGRPHPDTWGGFHADAWRALE